MFGYAEVEKLRRVPGRPGVWPRPDDESHADRPRRRQGVSSRA